MAVSPAQLLLLSATAAGAASVLELRGEAFEAATQSDRLLLIKFYAPWCAHCKRLAPIMKQVAEELPPGSNIVITKVDCTSQTKICKDWGIRGYPTIYLNQGAENWEFEGSRTKEGIQEILARMQRAPVTDLGVQPAAHVLRPPAGQVSFLYGRSASDLPVDAAFATAARRLQHIQTFFAAPSESASGWLAVGTDNSGGIAPPFLAKLEPGEAPAVVHGKDLTDMAADDIEEWIRRRRHPVFSLIEQSNFPNLRSDSRMLAVATVDVDGAADKGLAAVMAAEKAELARQLRVLARNETLQKAFLFGVLDGSRWIQFLDEVLQTQADELPRLILLSGSQSTRGFILGGASSASDPEEMRRFLERAAAGDLHVELQSIWGVPDRWYAESAHVMRSQLKNRFLSRWHFLKRQVPQLSVFDSLPHYSFTAPLVVLVVGLVVLLLLWPISPPEAKSGKRE